MTKGQRELVDGGGASAEWASVKRYLTTHGARTVVREVADAFRTNTVLTYASAVSYQILFALVPVVLASVAILGFLDLESVWTDTVAPRLQDGVSDAVFQVIDESVATVLTTQRGFWLTLGAGLALWELSGAVRAAMRGLTEIYGAEDARSFPERLAISLGLAVVLAILLGLAAVSLQVVPRLGRVVELGGFRPLVVAGGWVLAVLLIVVAVAVTMQFAPAVPQSMGWLGFGTLLVVVGWILASVAFVAYATKIASYGSIYGGLAVVILLLTYLYVSTLVFLSAAQIDALVRSHAEERA